MSLFRDHFPVHPHATVRYETLGRSAAVAASGQNFTHALRLLLLRVSTVERVVRSRGKSTIHRALVRVGIRAPRGAMTLGAESALGSAVSRRSSRPRALALGAVAARRARARWTNASRRISSRTARRGRRRTRAWAWWRTRGDDGSRHCTTRRRRRARERTRERTRDTCRPT